MRLRATLHSLWRSRGARVALLVALAVLIPTSILVAQGLWNVWRVQCSGATPTQTAGRSTAIAHASATVASRSTASVTTSGATQHDEYVFPDGGMYVYDIDNGHQLVKHVSLPTTDGVRGVVASPATRMLYVSHGGDGDGNGNGSLLAYDLIANRVVWDRHYTHGIDSMAISPNGQRIYMPDGELTGNGNWYVVDAATGEDLATIPGGRGPHNTIVSLNGQHVYLGGRNYNYLEVADTSTNQIIKKIGPLQSGVRPFTINGTETIAYTTATGFLGFQVSDITTGKVLYTVPIAGFTWNGSGPSAPSHGISLSPDERELYVMDSPNNCVHVFDVSGVPGRAPKQVATIHVTSMAGNESNCAYDCLKDGWLQQSGDGRFVYVGDSGDVIDTATRTVVATLHPLANTRKMLEIDWQAGVPVFTTSRSGLGYITH